MHHLFSQYTHIVTIGAGVITLIVVFIFVWQIIVLAVNYFTSMISYMEKLSFVSTQYARKVFLAPIVVPWKLTKICIQIILSLLSLVFIYLINYGTRILPVNPSTLWKIQQYGTPVLMEHAPWGVKWVRNIYGGYLNWLYPQNFELLSTMYSLVFMVSYLCRWLGYFVYFAYYYIIYIIRGCLLVICTPYIVEMVFFTWYYIYRRCSYYLNVTVYKISWNIYVGIRVQSYYLLPNLFIYYMRRFFNRNWQEWYFAENTQADGQTPDFIYMDNPSPYMIRLFKQTRPAQLDELNGGLGYVQIYIQNVILHIWAIFVILPLYGCYKMLELISKLLIQLNYNYMAYYFTCVRLLYKLWEGVFTLETKKKPLLLVNKGLGRLITAFAYMYTSLPAQAIIILKYLMAWLFYIVYTCVWFIYYTPSYFILAITTLIHRVIKYRVPLLLICICYWGNCEYISHIIYIMCDIMCTLLVEGSKYIPHWVGYVAAVPPAFSGYDLIAHVAPQISVGATGYPPVTPSIAFMERNPSSPHLMGYARYYQLYDLAYIHPRMKYWYSPVVYRWWDDLYYYYTDHIYAWLNLDPRARWMHLAIRLNTSVWKPYQVTRAWHSLGEWGVNWVPMLTVEGSAWRSNLFVTTPSQEQALWELEEPWSRVMHWPYGITRLNVGGYVDYHVGGRYLTKALSDYDAYSYVDIYRDGSAEAYELWLIKQFKRAMVESNLKIGWPFLNELTASPYLSRGDLMNKQGSQLQVITYTGDYSHLHYRWYRQLVMWKWGFMDNIPDILRKRDKFTWLNHLGTLGGSWDLYKIYIYSKWLRPFHGTLYGMQDWLARGFINIVWGVVNSRWMFWWQYSYYNFSLRLCIIISIINHLIIVYPYMWVHFLWNITNSYYTTFDMLYGLITHTIYYVWNTVITPVKLYGYPEFFTGAVKLPITSWVIMHTVLYKVWVYLCLDTLFQHWIYEINCYTWYLHTIYAGYIHLLTTSLNVLLYFFNESILDYYVLFSTQEGYPRIARYLDVLSSRQQLQSVLDWVYIQEKVASVTQIILQNMVETESGEWEDTVIILDISAPQVNPLADMGEHLWEEKIEPMYGYAQSPVEVQQITAPWLHEVTSLLCNHKGYLIWGGYVCKEIKGIMQFIFHMCVQLVHFEELYTTENAKGWTPRYSISNIFYLPVIIFTKLQYWVDSICVELQLPRRMQKYHLIYEYRRAGGHVKGHSQDLTYLRISPVRRSLLFSSYKWKPHNLMDYLQFVTSVQYTDPWWGGVIPYNGVKVAVGSGITLGQHNFPTSIMFNYPSNYVIRPLALSTIIMYYVTLFTLLLCNNNLPTLITCKQKISCNRQYAWDKFRHQPSSHLEWMFIPANKALYLTNYMDVTQKVEYKHLMFMHTLCKSTAVTHNHLIHPLLAKLHNHSLSVDTTYFSPSVYLLLSDNKYNLLCNNLQMPTDEFIKGVAFGYSKDEWIGKVTGKEEEEDYVEWDQAFTYNTDYAQLHVDKFNTMYTNMFNYEQMSMDLPVWTWHKDPYNLRIFERSIAEDLTSSVNYVYEERVEDSPYMPWGAIAWGCVVPLLLFAKPLVFMGKWWHHNNRPAHMLTQQFNFYMEGVLHHLGVMDYMALFTPRDMVNGKIGGHAHGAKPDLKRVYLLAGDSVYGSNFYTNYMGDDPIWLSEGKLWVMALYGGLNSSVEELRLIQLTNWLIAFMVIIYIFKRARVQPPVKFTSVSGVKYGQISHYIWIKKQGQRFFTWFWQ